jgi:RNA polymerase sigma factor (sigma-70 family)
LLQELSLEHVVETKEHNGLTINKTSSEIFVTVTLPRNGISLTFRFPLEIEELFYLDPMIDITPFSASSKETQKPLSRIARYVCRTQRVEIDLMRTIINEVTQYPLLTPIGEMVLLIRFTANGDPNAQERLLRSNMLLVLNEAFQAADHGKPFLDSFSAGLIGLLYAIDHFDISYPGKKGQIERLSTYAVIAIRRQIYREVKQESMNLSEKARRFTDLVYRTQTELEVAGLHPEASDIASVIMKRHGPKWGILATVLTNTSAVLKKQSVISLDYPTDPTDDGSDDRYDRIPNQLPTTEESCDDSLLREIIIEIINSMRLTYQERDIIESKFGLNKPQESVKEIAERYQVSTKWIYYLEEKILGKFRRHLKYRSLLKRYS